MKFFKLDFEQKTDKQEQFVSFFNSIYAMQYSYNNSLKISFGVYCDSSVMMFYMCCDDEFEFLLKNKLTLIDPIMEFEYIDDPFNNFKNNKNKKVKCFELKPIKDKKQKLKTGIEKNFLLNLLSSMKPINDDKCIFEITFQPTYIKNINKLKGDIIKKCTKSTINTLFKGVSIVLDESFKTNLSSMYETNNNVKKKDNKEKEQDNKEFNEEINSSFEISIKLISLSNSSNENKKILTSISSAFADLCSNTLFIPIELNYKDMFKRQIKYYNKFSPFELSQIIHLPSKDIILSNLNNCGLRKIIDKDIPKTGIVFGELNNSPLAFPCVKLNVETYEKNYKKYHSIIDNLCKPKLILGQQGSGKSEWLINYIISMAEYGIGQIIIDPKNDTQQRLIESIPNELLDKLVYVNLGDVVYPPAFNIFKKRNTNDPTENSLIVSSFMSLMKKESRQWGYKMERICKMTADAILLLDRATLNEFLLMLTEKDYRTYVIEYIEMLLKDKNVKGKSHIKKIYDFWTNYNEMDNKVLYKEFEPVLNIIGPFVGDRIVSAIVSQYDSFDFRKAADEGKIVIVNIPEGTLRDNTRLLASMINKSIWLDIQSRNDIDISKRYPVCLLIDEAHEIVDDEFISVLTKARAYRLGLTLVTQGLSNFKMRGMDNIKELITTNCKNKIVFRVGYSDSKEMEEEFYPLSFFDLNNCPDYHFYGKILLQGKVSNTFAGKAPDCAKKLRNYDEYINIHRSGKFTIDEIEDQIQERLDSIKLYFSLK